MICLLDALAASIRGLYNRGCAVWSSVGNRAEMRSHNQRSMRRRGSNYEVHARRHFTKEMGVFANPTSKASPAKLRVAFEVGASPGPIGRCCGYVMRMQHL